MIVASYHYQSGTLEAALDFLKRARWDLRTLRKVRLWRDHVHILDINGDGLEVTGIGYQHSEVKLLIQAVNAAFDPKTIHESTNQEYKELDTGRRHPWAEDRVM